MGDENSHPGLIVIGGMCIESLYYRQFMEDIKNRKYNPENVNIQL